VLVSVGPPPQFVMFGASGMTDASGIPPPLPPVAPGFVSGPQAERRQTTTKKRYIDPLLLKLTSRSIRRLR
jgi:hypothetical protein